METDRKQIHMSLTKGSKELMITVDDDFILSEGKPDIVGKIKERGEVVIDRVKGMDDKVLVAGYLHYRVLYRTEQGFDCTEDKIPFEEIVKLEGVTPQDIFKCVHYLEDLSVHIIHSRKINVKALIRINITAKALYDREAVEKISMDNLQSKTKKINVMTLLSSEKDVFRIREGINLPVSGDTVDKLLWYEMEMEGLEYRLRDGELGIKGELSVFCIYSLSQGEELNYYNEKIPFSGKLELNNNPEDAYADINATITEKNMTLRADNNGEPKLLDVEVIMDLDIKAYAEEKVEVLEDAYSPACDLEITREKIECENIVMKNNFQCKAEGAWGLIDRDAIRLLNSMGTVFIEEIISTTDGLVAEGAVIVDVLYEKSDKDNKLGFVRYKLPFSQKIEGVPYNDAYIYSCKTEGLKINTVLMNNEISIKCVLGIDMMLTKVMEDEIITNIKEGEPDYNRVKNLPGITGYIIRQGDTLWDIAKRYGTTIDKIMETNNMSSEEIQSGMKLLVVKTC